MNSTMVTSRSTLQLIGCNFMSALSAFSPRRIDIGLPREAEFWNSVSRVLDRLWDSQERFYLDICACACGHPSAVSQIATLEKEVCLDKEAVPRRDHILVCCRLHLTGADVKATHSSAPERSRDRLLAHRRNGDVSRRQSERLVEADARYQWKLRPWDLEPARQFAEQLLSGRLRFSRLIRRPAFD